MKKYMICLISSTFIFASGFDDGMNIGEKIKVRHMSNTHKNGIVGNTLYVYEADNRETIIDEEGALRTNSIHTDEKTLKKNRTLDIVQVQENIKIKRISGKTKNRDILKSQKKDRNKGVNIGTVDIRNTNIKKVKTYRRNNHYRIEE